jgi:hypothetical protein
MDWPVIVNLVASIATAIGVVLAAVGLWLTKAQAVTAYEDSISTEYRQIVKLIPVKALLGESLSETEFNECLSDVYNYIDFTNEQIYLRQQGRIRKKTWESWSEGIAANMGRAVIKEAWDLIKVKSPSSFSELRTLEEKNFRSDPRLW